MIFLWNYFLLLQIHNQLKIFDGMVVRIKINCGLGDDQCMLVKVYGSRECKIFFGFIAWIAKYLESLFQ